MVAAGDAIEPIPGWSDPRFDGPPFLDPAPAARIGRPDRALRKSAIDLTVVAGELRSGDISHPRRAAAGRQQRPEEDALLRRSQA